MVGAFSFEGPSVVLQQVRVRLSYTQDGNDGFGLESEFFDV